MAKAFGEVLAANLIGPACSVGSQSHIKHVRNPKDRRLQDAMAEKQNRFDAEKNARSRRVEFGGGDRIDPRLFYFRALLDGGRFFGGGRF